MATSKGHFLEARQLIAGAGTAGLFFAIALLKQWDPTLTPPTIHIYERDTREAANGRHGYCLTLTGYDEAGPRQARGSSVCWTTYSRTPSGASTAIRRSSCGTQTGRGSSACGINPRADGI